MRLSGISWDLQRHRCLKCVGFTVMGSNGKLMKILLKYMFFAGLSGS